MFKLLIVLPMMMAGMIALCLGSVLLLPLLALLPALLAVGAGLFAVVLAVGVIGLVLRVLAAMLIGVGGLVVAFIGLGMLVAGGAIVVALGIAMAHLLLPLLVILGLIWLIRRGSRPATPPLQVSHNGI